MTQAAYDGARTARGQQADVETRALEAHRVRRGPPPVRRGRQRLRRLPLRRGGGRDAPLDPRAGGPRPARARAGGAAQRAGGRARAGPRGADARRCAPPPPCRARAGRAASRRPAARSARSGRSRPSWSRCWSSCRPAPRPRSSAWSARRGRRWTWCARPRRAAARALAADRGAAGGAGALPGRRARRGLRHAEHQRPGADRGRAARPRPARADDAAGLALDAEGARGGRRGRPRLRRLVRRQLHVRPHGRRGVPPALGRSRPSRSPPRCLRRRTACW